MMRWRLVALLPITLGLAACGAGSAANGGPVTSLASLVEHKGLVPDAPVSTTKLQVAPVLQTGSVTLPKTSKSARRRLPSTMATVATGSGLGWVRSAEAEAYLARIIDRLERGLPQPTNVAVFISANNAYQAYSTPDREIILSIGMLDRSRSEGEIAAVLAHEMSHALLRHEEAEAQTRQILDATNVATSAGIVVGVASEMEKTKTAQGVSFNLKDEAAARAKMFRAARAGQYAVTFFDDLAANTNKREHEFEADLLGADLLARAGYEPLEMKRMLEYHLTQWQEEEKHRQTMQERLGEHIGQATMTGALGAVLSGDAGTLVSAVKDEVLEFGKGEIARAYTNDHPSPQARLELVSAYIEKHHGSAQGPNEVKTEYERVINARAFKGLRTSYGRFFEAMRMLEDEGDGSRALETVKKGLTGEGKKSAAGRLVAYNILVQMGRRDEAYDMLRGAQLSNDAPIAYYSALASEHAYRGKVQQAFDVIAAGETHFGSREIFAPTRIRLLKLQQNTQQIALELGQCNTYPHKEVVEACARAARTGNDMIEEGRVGQGLLEQAKSEAPGTAGAASVLQSITGVKIPSLGF